MHTMLDEIYQLVSKMLNERMQIVARVKKLESKITKIKEDLAHLGRRGGLSHEVAAVQTGPFEAMAKLWVYDVEKKAYKDLGRVRIRIMGEGQKSWIVMHQSETFKLLANHNLPDGGVKGVDKPGQRMWTALDSVDADKFKAKEPTLFRAKLLGFDGKVNEELAAKFEKTVAELKVANS